MNSMSKWPLLVLTLIEVCLAFPYGPYWDCNSSFAGFPTGKGSEPPFQWPGGASFCQEGTQSANSNSPTKTSTMPASTSNQGSEGPTSNPTTQPSQTSNTSPVIPSNSSLHGGAIIGIAVGAAIGVVLIALVAWLLLRRRRSSKDTETRPQVEPFRLAHGGDGRDSGDSATLFSNEKLQNGEEADVRRNAERGLRGDSTSPVHHESRSENGDSNAVDVHRLFGDRTFETRLRHFISQLPPPNPSSNRNGLALEMEGDNQDGLPAYTA